MSADGSALRKSATTLATAASSLKHGTRTAIRIDDGVIAERSARGKPADSIAYHDQTSAVCLQDSSARSQSAAVPRALRISAAGSLGWFPPEVPLRQRNR